MYVNIVKHNLIDSDQKKVTKQYFDTTNNINIIIGEGHLSQDIIILL